MTLLLLLLLCLDMAHHRHFFCTVLYRVHQGMRLLLRRHRATTTTTTTTLFTTTTTTTTTTSGMDLRRATGSRRDLGSVRVEEMGTVSSSSSSARGGRPKLSVTTTTTTSSSSASHKHSRRVQIPVVVVVVASRLKQTSVKLRYVRGSHQPPNPPPLLRWRLAERLVLVVGHLALHLPTFLLPG